MIGKRAFKNHTLLQGIVIPYNVKVIGVGAYGSCMGLINVKFCKGLEEIGEYAFYYCTSLQHIAIPYTVKGIRG